MLKRLAALLAAVLAPAVAAAQTAPAQMGITPTTLPEVLQVLDNTKTWVTIGNVDPTTHKFTGLGGGGGGEADILVTDPSVGMAPVTASLVTDNSPLLPALMSKMGPPNRFTTGYDVTWPSAPGGNYTEYYHTQPLVLTRGANYHCSGAAFAPSTYLIFAAGIDEVIQEQYQNTSDGGQAGGMLSNCNILTMGYGVATANPITPNVLTGVYFYGDPAGLIPLSKWQVGDGIMLTAYLNAFFPVEAIPAAPIGATVTAVGAIGGDGNPANAQNLTLSQPVSAFLGYTPHSTAVFTQTATNNFNNNDAIQAGPTTYKFQTAPLTLSSAQHQVEIGPTFDVSAANLTAAVNNTAGQMVAYVPTTSGPGGYLPDPNISASHVANSGVITFTSDYGGPAVNTFPSVYSTTGTAAGTFGAATFGGANDATTCPAPCTAANVDARFTQLPLAQAYQAQTTLGGNSVTLISGPRPIHSGDAIWSDAFGFGATIFTVNQSTFPQVVTVRGATFVNSMNATVTHPPGAETPLWVIPAAVKRRTMAATEHLNLGFAPIGLQMTCNDSFFSNCDLSRDRDDYHGQNWVGRWASGDNYSSSGSIDEQFTHNFIVDIFEGGALGEVYLNPNTSSTESSSAKYGFVSNCANQNATAIFGGYVMGNSNGCANPQTIYPPTPGGTPVFAPQIGNAGGGAIFGTTANLNAFQQMRYIGGFDNKQCAAIGPTVLGQWSLAFGNALCAAGSSIGLGWDLATSSWSWYEGNTNPVMRFAWPAQGYIGYTGFGVGVQFPNGVILAGDGNNNATFNARVFGMTNFKPTANWHLQGDTEINTVQSPGGQAAYYYAPAFSTTLTAAVVKGQPTSTPLSVAACPTVAPPAGTLVSDVSANLAPNVNLCVLSSCAAGVLTCTAATLNASFAANDAIKLLYPYGAGPISNDPANPDYTATTLRSGSASNKDIDGIITLAGGTATLSLVGNYASAPICLCQQAPASSGVAATDACTAFETVTNVTFTGAGTDKIKYHCIGRN